MPTSQCRAYRAAYRDRRAMQEVGAYRRRFGVMPLTTAFMIICHAAGGSGLFARPLKRRGAAMVFAGRIDHKFD